MNVTFDEKCPKLSLLEREEKKGIERREEQKKKEERS
jgi:hypothetical protein